MDLFNQGKPKYTMPKRPRLFESFAGVGMQRMAFERLGIDYEMVGISEIDKYAIQSYMAIHGDTKNYGDITKIKGEGLPQIDIFTYSFPCQDLSVSGKGKGMQQGTRSGLIFEVLRIMRELKEIDRLPGLLIMENVTALLNKKHIEGFEKIKQELAEIGYTNHLDKLNAKNYGVAQNRDRAFMISTLGDYAYEFPKPIPLEKRLKDYLENEVASNYYLSDTAIKGLTAALERRNTTIENEIDKNDLNLIQYPRGENKGGRISNQISPTIDQATGARNTAISIDNSFNNSREPRFYEDVCPTLNTMSGGNREPKVIIKEATKQGYAIAIEGDSINLEQPSSKTRRGRVGEGMANTLTTSCNQGVVEPVICASRGRNPINPKKSGLPTEQMIEVNESGLSNTLTTVQKDNMVLEQSLRIRKLTPLECWRLMGIDDEDFHNAKASGVSNSQLYKQAGNGLVVDVFAAILRTATEERNKT